MGYSFVVIVLVLVLVGTARPGVAAAQSAVILKLPFAAGTSWKIIQGYNGGTHVPGPERYALDLVREGGPTAGADVLAPASGTLWWMNPSGTGNGCLSIKMDNGNGLIVEMCHIIARSFQSDQRIEQGQAVGVIGPDGAVGNNGTAHLHLSMHRTNDYGVTRIPSPFALPDGLPLDGVSLPADGSRNQYACSGSCRPALVSTNGAGGSTVAAVPSATSAPVAAAPPTVSLRPGIGVRIATGGGAGDCVNVREGPGISAPIVTCLPDGSAGTAAQGPIVADGRSWWRLDDLGWAAADYLIGMTPPIPALRSGGRATVDAGTGDCLNLRAGPGVAASVVACLPSGARVSITSGPIDADGHTWWQIDGRGWAVADYLQPRDDS